MTDGQTYIQVVLPLKLGWQPYYIAESNITIGERVRVKFANKEYVSFVYKTGAVPNIPTNKILPIIEVENNLEKISKEEIKLWEMVADYYLCTLGEVYKSAYPSLKISKEEDYSNFLIKKEELKIKKISIINAKILKKEENIVKYEEKLQILIEKSLSPKNKSDKTADIEKRKDSIIKTKDELIRLKKELEELSTAPKTRELREWESINLSSHQNTALEAIKNSFNSGKPALLHGVTGSGKTEIYLKLAQETLAQGKNVLYLVPEITLSRQLEMRLERIFHNRLHCFHSWKTAVEKRNIDTSLRNGDNYIVLGTRSSVFLPHKNLGLIIIDEEHDSSYKQDSPSPRYNSRDSAIMLGLIHNTHTILGSATPSLESIYNCNVGKMAYINLPQKFHNGSDATIEIIDTIAEWKKNGMVGSFSRKLIAKINKSLVNKEQILILRARRSYSPALQCTNCGEIVKCPHCHVSLSFHKSKNAMECHYCGHTEAYTGLCRSCNGPLKGLGGGTQKIEEEAMSLFPEATIARLDGDTKQNKSFELRTIQDFEDGKIDILIGTQMISKGFDFENLNLVVILQADSLLGMEDFRADEKAEQVLSQFRGRCSRRGKTGTFIIQTAQPQHPVYTRLKDNSNSTPLILSERQEFGYPPYTRIINIIIKDKHEKRIDYLSQELSRQLEHNLGSEFSTSFQMIGPYLPTISKIADLHIRIIRLMHKKDKKAKLFKLSLVKSIESFEVDKKYIGHIVIDVDPH